MKPCGFKWTKAIRPVLRKPQTFWTLTQLLNCLSYLDISTVCMCVCVCSWKEMGGGRGRRGDDREEEGNLGKMNGEWRSLWDAQWSAAQGTLDTCSGKIHFTQSSSIQGRIFKQVSGFLIISDIQEWNASPLRLFWDILESDRKYILKRGKWGFFYSLETSSARTGRHEGSVTRKRDGGIL